MFFFTIEYYPNPKYKNEFIIQVVSKSVKMTCDICQRPIKTITNKHLHTKVCMKARAEKGLPAPPEIIKRIKKDPSQNPPATKRVLKKKIVQVDPNPVQVESASCIEIVPIEEELVCVEDIGPEIDLEECLDYNLPDPTCQQIDLCLRGKLEYGTLTVKGASVRDRMLFTNSDLRAIITSYIKKREPTKFNPRLFFLHTNYANAKEYLPIRVLNEVFHLGDGPTRRKREEMVRNIPLAVLHAISFKLSVNENKIKFNDNFTNSLLHSKFDKTPQEEIQCINELAFRGCQSIIASENHNYTNRLRVFKGQRDYLLEKHYRVNPRPIECIKEEFKKRRLLETYNTRVRTELTYKLRRALRV